MILILSLILRTVKIHDATWLVLIIRFIDCIFNFSGSHSHLVWALRPCQIGLLKEPFEILKQILVCYDWWQLSIWLIYVHHVIWILSRQILICIEVWMDVFLSESLRLNMLILKLLGEGIWCRESFLTVTFLWMYSETLLTFDNHFK